MANTRHTLRWIVGTSTLLLTVASAAYAEVRGPQPGEVYREYIIKPTNTTWRITDPNATYQGPPGNSPDDFLPNAQLPFTIGTGQLTGAVRAEAVVDAWGGHVGTVGQQMRVNGRPWLNLTHPVITVPPAASPVKDSECYTHQWNPAVDVPLSHLIEGGNWVQGNSGGQTCFNFNWGQWGWYAIVLRVYYDPAQVAHPTGSIASPATGSTFRDNPTLAVQAASGRPIDRVDFLAWYDGYDTDGDGDFTEYHHSYHRSSWVGPFGISLHAGSATGGATSAAWDTTLVPDQAPGTIRLMARICDREGMCYATPEARNLTLERPNHSVQLFKPEQVPNRFWVRSSGTTKSSRVTIPAHIDLSRAESAWLLARTWNGISGHSEANESHWRKVNGVLLPPFGANHYYSFDVVNVPVTALAHGANTVTFFANTVHHGIEILWPGPALIVRFATSQPVCGDGRIDPGETCDAAGDSAGCDADCTAVLCGDGYHNDSAGEACDDGNRSDADGCRNDCTLPAGPLCGNAVVDPGETCDHGGSSETCDADCTVAECGDGTLNGAAGETCDDGNTATGDACRPDCTLPPTNALPAYYGFEETGQQVLDSSGNGNHGTLVGAVRDPAGRFGQALRFNGTSDRVDLGHLDAGGTALTLAAWFRADDFGVVDGRIISKTASATDQDHYLMLSTISSNGMRLRFRIKTLSGGTHTLVGTGNTIRTGAWIHVAATYDGTTMRLYQDGELVGSMPASGAIAVGPTVPVALGDNPDGSRPFDGLIDEVRLEPRALSAAEIRTWMQQPVESTGGCERNDQCDDGLACNGAETCSAGSCRAGTPPACDDGLACTADSCDEVLNGCRHEPRDEACDNGLFCDGAETCDAEAGCLTGAPVACSDGVACTVDRCDETADGCAHLENHAFCNDGAWCNGAETCAGNRGCIAGQAPCPDGLCDDDANSCAECALDLHCDDGVFCNGAETCTGGVCRQAGDPCSASGQVCNELADACESSSSPRLETVRTLAGGDVRTVPLSNRYDRPVIVCSVLYRNNTVPVVTRLGRLRPGSFELRLQDPSGREVLDDEVHCLVVEEGVWVVDGVKLEAVRYYSTRTDSASTWIGQARTYGQDYASPVVLGQVMTSSNEAWSVFWARGADRLLPPGPGLFHAGKAVGEDPNRTRAHETVGYVVLEAGQGFLGGVEYRAGVGADSIRGYDNGPPAAYEIAPALAGGGVAGGPLAVVSLAGMQGADGGWAAMDEIGADRLRLFVDEDQTRDAERLHTTEQVAYLVLGGSLTYPAAPQCDDNADCDDGLYCNGSETCGAGRCVSAGNPCGGGGICDEQADVCAECLVDADCGDGATCAAGVCLGVCQPGLPYAEVFGAAAEPAGWFDTGAENSLLPANGFGRRYVGGEAVFGTGSGATNIHSHYVTAESGAWHDYTYSGRLRISSAGGGVGVTALADYPDSDRYYRLRRWSGGLALQLSAHGTNLSCDGASTGVDPAVDTWYRFEVRVESTSRVTTVRAVVWPDGATRPNGWQQVCTDAGPNRLTAGTVGVWSMGSGYKYWDDLAVTCN